MRISLPNEKFYVLRHAETFDNAADVASGKDSATALTEEGKRQAQAICDLLAKFDGEIDRVVTSEADRTRHTAEIVCYNEKMCNLPRSVNPGINERVEGEAEGKTKEEIAAIREANGGNIPGQEDKEDFSKRVLAAVKEELDKGGVPLFITHGGSALRMIEGALHIDDAKKHGRMPNCVLHEFIPSKSKGGKWKVHIVELDENKDITRRSFGKSKAAVDKIAGGNKAAGMER